MVRLAEHLRKHEREHLSAALAATENRKQAAAVLGIGLRTLYYKLEKHKLLPRKES